ncbi:zonular occludens toxin domain-containing protein [Acinetobacter sp.]|uniref:zonular occludens toxin domain-containing protein n=1 Tax=Acinetobacter sp. TaxID=472 RepID=UPI000C0A8221|nr:zonular occludens toxin domain-containing protein [Acinetobacter sp.]MAK30802.1 hypothetical protein [Acinetobacter sp.]
MSTFRLITGGIGTGKTLWTVEQLFKLKNLTPDRLVYTDITGIKHTGVTVVPPDFDWRNVEDNSLIIFDEVQYKELFSRHNSKRDKQILDLTTMRKRGIEIWCITQRARFLNQDVLGLVNEHIHLEKTGDKTARVYIWHEAETNITKTKKMFPFEKYVWQHPTDLYGFYESIKPDAVHHKRSYFNKGIVAVVITLLLALIPAIYLIKQGSDPNKIQATSSNQKQSSNEQPNKTAPDPTLTPDVQAKMKQCVDQFKWTPEQCREAYDPTYLKKNNDDMLAKTQNDMNSIVVKYNPNKPFDNDDIQNSIQYQVTAKPVLAGCMTTKNGKLQGYSQQGTKLDVSQDDCKKIIAGDRPFNYFVQGQQNAFDNQANTTANTTANSTVSGQQNTSQPVPKMTAEQYAKYIQYLEDQNLAANSVQHGLERNFLVAEPYRHSN